MHGGSTGHHLDRLQRQGTNAARVSCSAKDTELKALKSLAVNYVDFFENFYWYGNWDWKSH